MRKWVAKQLLRRRLSALDGLAVTYAQPGDAQAIARIQLVRFNVHWEMAWRNIPFYTEWRNEHRLPDRIEDIRKLAEFPVLTKTILSERRDLIERTPGISRYTLTGGTSGVSTAFPMNAENARSSWMNTHLGRLWNGVMPGDRLFMIWGHSHLFSGNGFRIKQCKRCVKDWAVNICRVSAYDLSESALDRIAEGITNARPDYVIGYGSCLSQLSHHLKDQGRDLTGLGVRRVVNTSETMCAMDEPHVKATFGCPVINEYGMAEAGVIGYSVGSLYPIKLFWNDYIVRLADSRILLTTLSERCFPLINYDTEDFSNDPTPETGSALELYGLQGKARDIFSICDAEGKRYDVSVVLFDHVLKQIKQLRSLHYTLRADGGVRIEYTAEGTPLTQAELNTRFTAGLAQEGIVIASPMITFHRLDAPLQTVAGKRVTLKRETI